MGSGSPCFPPPLPSAPLLHSQGRQSQRPLCRRKAITQLPAGSAAVHITAPLMCRLLPHICIISFPFFSFPGFYILFLPLEPTWCVSMVEQCQGTARFSLLKMSFLCWPLKHPNLGPVLVTNRFFNYYYFSILSLSLSRIRLAEMAPKVEATSP